MTFYPPWVGNVKQAGRLRRSGDERGGGAGCEMLLRTSSRTQREAMPGGLFAASPPRKRAAPRRGASRAGARNLGGLEGLGMPSGKALGQTSGQTSGRHASPLRGKARRIGIKKCQPSYMFLSLYQQPLPPFRRAEQHLPGADVHRQNRHVSVSPRKPPAMAICATSSSNRRKKHRSSLGTSLSALLSALTSSEARLTVAGERPQTAADPLYGRRPVSPVLDKSRLAAPLPAACFPFSAALQTRTSPKAQSAAPHCQKQTPAPPSRSRPLFHAKRAGKCSRRVAIGRMWFTPTRG